jgi:transposase InsO family protein
MPWLETHVQEQRIQFVIAMQQPGAKLARVCRAFHISRTTGYKWLARESEAHSVTALTDRSRRPHRSPRRTSPALTQRVVALHEEFGWGGDKLVTLLDAEGRAIAPRTVDRIIQREGLTRADAAPAPALTRFERPAPNDLWQMDAKGHYPLRPSGRCHPLSVLDDHSRYAVGLVALPALESVGVRAALTACFERHGLPTAMLMDHGVPWWSATNEGGLTTLSVFLLKQGIRLLYGRVRHPQTQGKVERFHRTLGERVRWWGVPTDLAGFAQVFARFRDEYNDVRPHEALAMQPPASRFTGSGRAYIRDPPAWEYPPGSEVHRVNQQGMLTYGTGRYFVSQVLAGEAVACRALKRRVLVTYRQMYVRELHTHSGRSVPLWQPAS